jgi:hypothetical protein
MAGKVSGAGHRTGGFRGIDASRREARRHLVGATQEAFPTGRGKGLE